MTDESDQKRPWYSFRYGWQFWVGLVIVLAIVGDMVIVLTHAIEAAIQTAGQR
jgi:hypothetical protein